MPTPSSLSVAESWLAVTVPPSTVTVAEPVPKVIAWMPRAVGPDTLIVPVFTASTLPALLIAVLSLLSNSPRLYRMRCRWRLTILVRPQS